MEPVPSDREGERVRELAEAVADRTPIDWAGRDVDAAGGSPSGSVEHTPIDGLRAIDRIASAYAAGWSDAPAAAGMASTTPSLFTWKHLRVIERLGAGSAGEVYRAVDPHLEREVALKLRGVPGTGGAERYLDEARRLARVRHPNVVTVFGADVEDDRIGLWCELLEGQTMEERLAEDGPLGPGEATLVGLELTRALAAIHGAGLVHGDVKAANVMRRDGGGIVLLDFSSVSERYPDEESRAATRTTGTPLTLAPEVIAGDTPSVASDIYALGVLLYRLVSGHYPVPATTWPELMTAHQEKRVAPLRDRRADLPAAFVRVVERARAPEPRDRFASAGEMEHALDRALSDSPAPRAAAGERSRAGGFRAIHPLRWILILASAASLALFLPRLLSGPGRSPAVPAPAPAMGLGQALAINATLYRVTAAATEPISSGALVRPSDQLFLEIEGRVPLHVYVLDEDDRGALFVLFPVPGLDLANPLPPHVRHRLPGALDGVSHDWTVTTAGGRETILIIASREALPPLERELAGLPVVEAETGPVYAELDPEALEGLRGIAGLSPSRTASPASAGRRLIGIAETYRREARDRNDIWLSEIELTNPR